MKILKKKYTKLSETMMEQFIHEFIAAIEPNPTIAPILFNTFQRVVKKTNCDLTNECVFDITLPSSVCSDSVGKDINLHELATRIETKFDCVVTDYDNIHLRAIFKQIDRGDTSVQEYIDDYTCKR
jgi:hypothetical protein